MEGLAAQMTKLLSSMSDMETRMEVKLLSSMGDMETRMEARITSMESRLQPPPTSTPAASMPYGMPGYGSTTLASSSSTAAATLSTAPNVFADPADHQGSVRRHKGYNSPDTIRSPGDDTT